MRRRTFEKNVASKSKTNSAEKLVVEKLSVVLLNGDKVVVLRKSCILRKSMTLTLTLATEEMSRKGRELQRYEDGHRLLCGCIPYQFKEGERSMQILMVTPVNGRYGLVFPKGGWETDESAEDSALREAHEEAGVRGLVKKELGTWVFTKKSELKDLNPEGLCRAYMFAMEVTEELDTWPEQPFRQRRWFAISEAIHLCRHEWMRDALEKFMELTSSSSSSSSSHC